MLLIKSQIFSRLSIDASYGVSDFGYKLHTKSDIDHGLIRDIETTTASVHDSQIDLSKPGEVATEIRGISGQHQRVIMRQ